MYNWENYVYDIGDIETGSDLFKCRYYNSKLNLKQTSADIISQFIKDKCQFFQDDIFEEKQKQIQLD